MLSKTMAILLGLIRQKPLNAYEMIKQLERMEVRHWLRIADSTVYATLRAACGKGFIDGAVERTGSMPERTVYTITQSGERAFLSTLERFIADFDYDITPYSIAVFFLESLDAGRAETLLRERETLLENYRLGIAEQIRRIAPEPIPPRVVCNVTQNLYIVEAQLKGVRLLLETLGKEKSPSL